ncbi:MAG: hypothetical protein LBN18_04460 [Dysgonamonadaceae bacterium]|jgi:hypothetical protein|nr:hypothetical protein [Dysgonamonadaceae bacterium]
MKKKIFLTILALLFFVPISYGQNTSYQYLDTLVTDYVKKLQSQNIDTICVYKDYCVGCVYSIKDEADRCAYSSIFIPTYILWINQGKTFLSKKDNCFDYSTIEIDSTALWKIFFKNQKRIKKEKVKFFEYIVYENKKKEVYSIMADHSQHHDFEMIIKGESIVMKFDEFNLQKQSDAEYNINYEHNKNLKGKMIVDELEKLTQEIEKRKLLEKKRR